MTPPQITLVQNRRPPQPGDTVTFSATGHDVGSGVDPDSAVWMFGERRLQSKNTTTGTQTTHKVGSKRVVKFSLQLKDMAGNVATYSWFVNVRDIVRPQIDYFGVTSVPFPGARTMRLVMVHDEMVAGRILITQGNQVLYRGFPKFWNKGRHVKLIKLRRSVNSLPIEISGVARDRSGNTTVLPRCRLIPLDPARSKCFRA